jgi:hypothetical protein
MLKLSSLAPLVVGIIALAGCSHTEEGADGSKVTVKPGGDVVATDAKGNKVTMTSKNGETTIKSKDVVEHVGKNNTFESHDTKGNSVSVGKSISEADLTLPFYPGSKELSGAIQVTDAKGTKTAASYRSTTDDAAKVVAFYTAKLGKPINAASAPGTLTAGWKEGKRSVALLVTKGDGGTQRISLTASTEK